MIRNMRVDKPTLKVRRQIHKHLVEKFANVDQKGLNRAITLLCRFYRVRRPKRIVWYEYIDRGRTLGRTYEDGQIHMVHPEHWKGTAREWIAMFYHEWKHYLYWFDMESKADHYANQMMRHCETKVRV